MLELAAVAQAGVAALGVEDVVIAVAADRAEQLLVRAAAVDLEGHVDAVGPVPVPASGEPARDQVRPEALEPCLILRAAETAW